MKSRIRAFLIDLMMIKVIYYGCILNTFLFLNDLNIKWSYTDFVSIKSKSLACLYLVFTMYFALSFYLGNGKTIGKLIFGLKVYSHNKNKHLSFKESFLRSLGYGLSTLCFFLPFTLAFFTKRKETFACLISKTYSGIEDSKPRFEVIEYLDEYKKAS